MGRIVRTPNCHSERSASEVRNLRPATEGGLFFDGPPHVCGGPGFFVVGLLRVTTGQDDFLLFSPRLNSYIGARAACSSNPADHRPHTPFDGRERLCYYPWTKTSTPALVSPSRFRPLPLRFRSDALRKRSKPGPIIGPLSYGVGQFWNSLEQDFGLGLLPGQILRKRRAHAAHRQNPTE